MKIGRILKLKKVKFGFVLSAIAVLGVSLSIVGYSLENREVGKAAAQDTGKSCFQETSYCIGGDNGAEIKKFWQSNNGMVRFGFPISEISKHSIYTNDGNGEPKTYYVQYFERNRIEHHPYNNPPYDIQLGHLGREVFTIYMGPEPSLDPFKDDEIELWENGGCFEANEKKVCNKFKEYWENNCIELDEIDGCSYKESLYLWGLPISHPGKDLLEEGTYHVQYFERARFELHSVHGVSTGPVTDLTTDDSTIVLLGLLGNRCKEIGSYQCEQS